MTATDLPDAIHPPPRVWWAVVAGAWFALLSQAPLWLLDTTLFSGLVNAPGTYGTDPVYAGSVALATFVAGVACWRNAVRRIPRFLGTGTSLGLATSIMSLLINPYAWLVSFASFLLFPIVFVALIVLGSIGLQFGFRFCMKVWPDLTVERDARERGADPSP